MVRRKNSGSDRYTRDCPAWIVKVSPSHLRINIRLYEIVKNLKTM